MKAVVLAAFNQEKALVGAFCMITNLQMELFEALVAAAADMLTADKQTENGSLLQMRWIQLCGVTKEAYLEQFSQIISLRTQTAAVSYILPVCYWAARTKGWE